MSSNLVQLIFNQFIEIVERFSRKSCFDFNECDFEYRVHEQANHRLLDVILIVIEKCNRRRDVVATIDFTNICTEDLTTCKWVDYLEKLARKFINNICPNRLMIVKNNPKKCRPQPPQWKPLPCRKVTTIIRKNKPVVEPECEIIVERECECIPICNRAPCAPKHELIIRHQTEKPRKCGDHDSLVVEPEEKNHDWNWHNGNPDYNHHKWRKCCGNNNNNDNQN